MQGQQKKDSTYIESKSYWDIEASEMSIIMNSKQTWNFFYILPGGEVYFQIYGSSFSSALPKFTFFSPNNFNTETITKHLTTGVTTHVTRPRTPHHAARKTCKIQRRDWKNIMQQQVFHFRFDQVSNWKNSRENLCDRQSTTMLDYTTEFVYHQSLNVHRCEPVAE